MFRTTVDTIALGSRRLTRSPGQGYGARMEITTRQLIVTIDVSAADDVEALIDDIEKRISIDIGAYKFDCTIDAVERTGYLCVQNCGGKVRRICVGCTSACAEPVFAYPES